LLCNHAPPCVASVRGFAKIDALENPDLNSIEFALNWIFLVGWHGARLKK
jgi:hypothetical protein